MKNGWMAIKALLVFITQQQCKTHYNGQVGHPVTDYSKVSDYS